MEIHNLSVSMCPEEVEKWLIERSSSSQLQVLSFTSLNGEFALKLQYKGISFFTVQDGQMRTIPGSS